MSEEIPDKIKWIVQCKSSLKKWTDYRNFKTEREVPLEIVGLRSRYPQHEWRIVEQTISSKVVEG